METSNPNPTPAWVRHVVNHVDHIPLSELKRALDDEVEQAVAATDRGRWREHLLAIRQVCVRLVGEFSWHDSALEPEPEEPPSSLSMRIVKQRIAALPRIILQGSEAERRRALIRTRVLCDRILRTLIGLVVIGGCALCVTPGLHQEVVPLDPPVLMASCH